MSINSIVLFFTEMNSFDIIILTGVFLIQTVLIYIINRLMIIKALLEDISSQLDQ